MQNRYTCAQTRTLQQAQDKLQDMYATGEILEGEKPLIEPIGGGYAITIEETAQ